MIQVEKPIFFHDTNIPVQVSLSFNTATPKTPELISTPPPYCCDSIIVFPRSLGWPALSLTLRRKEGDGNETTREKEERKA